MAEKRKNAKDTPAAAPDLFGGEAPGGTNERDFESLLARVEEIVKKMESGGMTLSESLELFEEGSRNLERLTSMLGAVREKVLLLVNGADGKPVLRDDTGEISQ